MHRRKLLPLLLATLLAGCGAAEEAAPTPSPTAPEATSAALAPTVELTPTELAELTPTAPADAAPTAPAEPTRTTAPAGPSPTIDPAVPPGPIVFASTRDGGSDIYTMNPDGTNLRRMTNGEGRNANPVWSTRGERIAFQSTRDDPDPLGCDPATCNYEIYVMDADGSNVKRLTNHPQPDTQPFWSPDSNHIVFTSRRDGYSNIYRMRNNGTDVFRITTSEQGEDQLPIWAPDTKHIIFQSSRDGNLEIYKVRTNGGEATNLTQSAGADAAPAFTLDGQSIVFVSDRGGTPQLHTMTLEGKEPTLLSPVAVLSGSRPAFGPGADQALVVVDERPSEQSNDNLALLDLQQDKLAQVFDHPAEESGVDVRRAEQ